MADLSLEKAYGTLKRGVVAPVYYLTGTEEILKDELAAAIAEAVLDPSARDFNLDARTAADLDGEALHALVETPPMLAERRVVIVRGTDQWRKNAKVWAVLYRYLERPSPTTVLVLTQAGDADPDARIARASAHVALNGLKPDQAARWVARRAALAGVTLEPDAASHLTAAVGGDLGHLALELEKLAAAAVGDAPVTVAEVARLVGVRRGETVQDWVDAVLARDGRRALELLDVVLQQSAVGGVQLISALGTALVGVRLARALADAGTPWPRVEGAVFEQLRIARPGRLRNWAVEAAAWTLVARDWSAEHLAGALASAAAADRRLKSTTITDERGILMSLLLELPLARVAA
jgi:DNA polymerase III delta subunit